MSSSKLDEISNQNKEPSLPLYLGGVYFGGLHYLGVYLALFSKKSMVVFLCHSAEEAVGRHIMNMGRNAKIFTFFWNSSN